MDRSEDFCFVSLYEQFVRYAFRCCLTGFVIIEAQINFFDMRVILETLKEHAVCNRAGCCIGVFLPLVRVKRDIRKHIYRCFEQKNLVACAVPMKAVFGYATFGITFIGALRASTSLMSMTWHTIGIVANEHGVVVRQLFIDHIVMSKGIYHITT